jgi:hypothetical protein
VHFDCTKLINYETTKSAVEQAGKHTMTEVCNNYFLGLKYGLNAVQDFDTIDHDEYDESGNKHMLFINSDLDFDDESIMLYSSVEFMNPDNDGKDAMQVPLAFWKHRGVEFDPPETVKTEDLELIEVNWEVSQGDYEGVMYLYSWEE